MKLALADEEHFTHEGVIDFVDNTNDPNTGTLDNSCAVGQQRPDAQPWPICPRALADRKSIRRAVLISEEALIPDQGQKSVWVLGDDDVAMKRSVEIRHASRRLASHREGTNIQ